MLTSLIETCSPAASGSNLWTWSPAHNGVYTLAASYNNLRRRTPLPQPSPIHSRMVFKRLWSTCSPRKTVPCAWKLLKGRLPTVDNLTRRGMQINSALCPLCSEEDETMDHLFFRCKISYLVWAASLKMVGT